jgi:hypothetical protein
MMRIVMVALAFFCFAVTASAQDAVSGLITQLRTGWGNDSFGIILDNGQLQPQPNPAGCHEGNLGYISQIDEPGYHTYYAMALTAYVARRPVTVTIDHTKCSGSGNAFPKIIGINMP